MSPPAYRGVVGAGVAIGLAASFALGSVMQTLLFQVSARDAVTMTAIAAVVLQRPVTRRGCASRGARRA